MRDHAHALKASVAQRGLWSAADACAAVATRPQDSEGWRRLGKLLHGKGRLEAASFALTRAANLDLKGVQARLDLANVERSLQRVLATMEKENPWTTKFEELSALVKKQK